MTRLFTSTLGETLAELLQNARRAGASLIKIDTPGQGRVRVRDDGRGIEQPGALLAFGARGWSGATAGRRGPRRHGPVRAGADGSDDRIAREQATQAGA